eukprot:CAMPEP_0176186438 /NCGR_PEP_ID=MMETSP0121_2-20121125/1870_1 /TAXON_ID=160619 /ORGANISM="Kryptoperidinium foliaceum, Strain CCMP 1326" /LENGTH=88 /DNA_ID=CAMNT_0017524923 /DNA_START=44 /DNA_END=306 /DNA_ORIENTATION=-
MQRSNSLERMQRRLAPFKRLGVLAPTNGHTEARPLNAASLITRRATQRPLQPSCNDKVRGVSIRRSQKSQPSSYRIGGSVCASSVRVP